MASGRTPKDNVDTSLCNTYYASDQHQSAHYVKNQDIAMEQHWHESRGAFGASKLPGPRGNPHLIRPKPEPSTKPPSNPSRDAQAYMKGLYDMKMDQARASANWIGASVTPGPKGNPGCYQPFPVGSVVSVDRPTPDGNISVLHRNQQRCFEKLANERDQQIDRAFTGRVFEQGFQ
eukprot:CAMPEP_0178994096 /NCGR_PEP_ID=MMETSP0795-20121207/7085_1 /TAXON_ID=88552 /ORGANISM="Amoebophrya sp., Strain Ameob2" /LENGTH=175 /DNA_ID=CAMNT_0020686261 /DNA_START=87 /DNA_END=614 /DNA_ORIENTATION=-